MDPDFSLTEAFFVGLAYNFVEIADDSEIFLTQHFYFGSVAGVVITLFTLGIDLSTFLTSL